MTLWPMLVIYKYVQYHEIQLQKLHKNIHPSCCCDAMQFCLDVQKNKHTIPKKKFLLAFLHRKENLSLMWIIFFSLDL